MIPYRALLASLAVAIVLPAARADDARPLRVLLVAGGCCHDYTRQKAIIADGLAARARIEVTAIQQGGTASNSRIPLYENPDWAKGYDVVIHDECFSEVKDPAWTARILAPHKAGLPAVVIHCAMHCYRDGTDEWFKFCGVTSHGHGAAYPHEVLNVDAAHPIMQGFGPAWANPAGELYWISKVWPTAHPLGTARNREKGNDEVCVWTNQYGKARVFGTTLGHHNETVGAPKFLDLLTRGVLWSAGALDDAYLKPSAAREVPANLAEGRPVVASSVQAGNDAARAVDGKADTRWCAEGPSAPQWLRVDLGAPTKVNALRIDWESDGGVYRYQVEGSDDGAAWRTLLDASRNDKISLNDVKISPQTLRYVRLTFLGAGSGAWGSVRELAVFGETTTRIDPAASARAAEAAKLADVKAPSGFDLTLFAAPPAVDYPVFVAATPGGDLYVSCDRNGSLDRAPHRGSVVRLRDLDGDGRADEAKRFIADVDSPRGLVFDRDRLYLLHPPDLSAFIDRDGDGVADERKTLVKGIGFTYKDRPGDHTSNGVTLGIDGWLYLAIGDFGFLDAEGADGRKLSLRGGGVVRVRPDGSGLELYSRGTRNILEVAIDPLLNGFARDNTNDGGGWDIRLHHVSGLENHGYPSLFRNFTDEVVSPLADYGGGSGCGALYLSEPGFPDGFGHALYTADWGRDRVFRHRLTPNGATFRADQTEFLTLPRVTDLDADAMGHIYAASWKGATFTFAGEEVGYIVRVTPKGNRPEPLPNDAQLDRLALIQALESPSHRRRIEAQRTLLARGLDDRSADALAALAADGARPLPVRVAALFTLEQGREARSIPALARFTSDQALRPYALRALADRADLGDAVTDAPAIKAARDARAEVRLAAAFCLARVGGPRASAALASLLGDSDPVVAHTAVRALVALKADADAFAVVDANDARPAARLGALRVLGSIHETRIADALIRRLDAESRPARRLGLLSTLARLDHREGTWRGDSWGTRPDTSGPYYQPEAWEATPTIEAALKAALSRADADAFAGLLRELGRNKVDVAGDDVLLARAASDPRAVPAVVAHLAGAKSVGPTAVPLLARIAAGRDPAGLRSEATVALLHANGPDALCAAVDSLVRLEAEGAGHAEFARARDAFLAAPATPDRRRTLEDLAATGQPAASAWALAALLKAAGGRDKPAALKAFESAWSKPSRRVGTLHAAALAGYRAAGPRVIAAMNDADPAVASAAREAARALNLELPGEARPTGPQVGSLPIEATLAAVAAKGGDVRLGERIFTRLSCLNCHTIRATDPPRGPFLGTIAATYKRRELAEAILLPSKTLAQGFATNVVELDDGRTVTGFVVKEAADGVTLRDADGKELQIPAAQIVDRAKSAVSVMPEGLVKDLAIDELAGLLAYLESLAKGQPIH